jgi:hypothetical protein
MNIIIRFIKVKSNLNISMAKKINKYSWIHELNAAAMKAKLLSESKIYSKQVQLNEADETYSGLAAGMQKRGRYTQVRPGDENLTPDQIKALLHKEKMARGTLHRLDPEAIAAVTRALGGSVSKPKDLKVTDVNRDGNADAFDVAADGQNGIMGDGIDALDVDDIAAEASGSPIDSSLMARYPSLQRGIKFGRQDELAAEEARYEEEDYLRREGGYTGRQGERP